MRFRNFWIKVSFTLIAIALIAMLTLTVRYVARYTEEKLALEDSSAFTSIISDMQSYYSQEIVAHAKSNNIKIAKDYKTAGAAIPFPATFTHDFIKKLNAKYSDLNFHFFSDKPFYHRVGGGPRDQFERDALGYFQKSRKNEIHRIIETEDGRYFRYAHAIWMEGTCVTCHNSHPDSPYKSWKVGDLRGVQSISIRLPGFSFIKNDHLNPLVMIIVALYVFVAFFLMLLFVTLGKLINEKKQKKIIRDQNDQLISAQQAVQHSANIDAITELNNRRNFYNFLEKRLSDPESLATGFSVMIIDLDHFKNINDRYGHSAGDALLKSVGKRIEQFTRSGDIVARLSGDEFAICFNGLTDIGEIHSISMQLIEEFEKPVEIENIVIGTGVSIGVSRYPEDGASTDIIMSNASLALNKAKTAGRHRCWFFDRELQNKTRQDDVLEIDLKSAISKNELQIFYQPKVSLKTGEITGFEALIRWPHANQGFISPEDFLPIAEERGLIIPVSRYVARRVAFDMATWLDKKMLRGRIAVNIHSHQLKSRDEMEQFMQIFEDFDIPPDYLTLEITEGCVIGRGAENTFGIMKQLSEKGIKISLDDFGTGYASLTHLKNLPVQEVKIDKSFLKDITTNRESEAIVSAIIDLSRKIGLQVVAEGIETTEQLRKLQEMDCDIGQGFLFAPPSMMIVANGLLTLPNLFRDIVQNSLGKTEFRRNSRKPEAGKMS